MNARPLRRRSALLAASLFAMRPGVAAAGSPAVPSRAPARTVLPNGLTVIVEEQRSADTVALEVAARVGSRDDGDVSGIAAFTSRMLLQGTPRRPTEPDVQRTATLLGGSLARVSAAETSTFAIRMAADDAETGFDLLSDVLGAPTFDQAAIVRQQRLVLQDLARRRTVPATVLGEAYVAALFAGHPLSSPALGTEESVRGITRQMVVDQHRQLWGAANMVLVVVGRIGAAAALAAAQRYFGGLQGGVRNERTAVPPPPVAPQTVRDQVGADQAQTQFRLGFPAPARLHADYPAMVVLNALTAGTTGAVYRELRSARGLAYAAGSGYLTFTDAGTWYASAGVDPDQADAALDIVREIVDRLREGPPDAGVFAEKVTQLTGSDAVAAEGNAPRASRLAGRELLGIASAEETNERIRQVTPDDVVRVARTYLDPSRGLAVLVGPLPGAPRAADPGPVPADESDDG